MQHWASRRHGVDVFEADSAFLSLFLAVTRCRRSDQATPAISRSIERDTRWTVCVHDFFSCHDPTLLVLSHPVTDPGQKEIIPHQTDDMVTGSGPHRLRHELSVSSRISSRSRALSKNK